MLTQSPACVRVVKVKGMWQTGNVLHCLWSLREFDSRHSRQIKWRQDLRLCERTGKTVLAKVLRTDNEVVQQPTYKLQLVKQPSGKERGAILNPLLLQSVFNVLKDR